MAALIFLFVRSRGCDEWPEPADAIEKVFVAVRLFTAIVSHTLRDLKAPRS
jgi:hypothetical protein